MPNKIEDKINKIRHIADGRTCLSTDGDLCPCQKEQVFALLKEEMEGIVPDMADIDTTIQSASEVLKLIGFNNCRAELLKRISERIK